MVKFHFNGTGITAACFIEDEKFLLTIRRLEDITVLGSFYKVHREETTNKENLNSYVLDKQGKYIELKPISSTDLIFDSNIKQLLFDYLDKHKINSKIQHQHKLGWRALEEIREEIKKIIQGV